MTRIMVVDDDPLICQLLAYQLGGAGYEVCIAHNGRDALGRLIQEQPDLILLDVVMPGMSGWDVCNQIRACSNVPVIMITARSTDNDVVTGLQSGADDYISKPFSLPQLLARIEAVLRRSRQPVARSHSSNNGNGIPGFHPPRQHREGLAGEPPPVPSDFTDTTIPTRPPPRAPHPPSSHPRLGQTFAEARKRQGLSLREAEATSGIRWEFIQAIEREHFGVIPRAELRQVLKGYSEFLGIDVHALLKRPNAPRPSPPWLVLLALGMIIVLLMSIALLLVLL